MYSQACPWLFTWPGQDFFEEYHRDTRVEPRISGHLGYHIDSLDICFGTQLMDSRGDMGVGVDAHSRLWFSGRNLGALFEVLYVGLSIMNLKLFDAYRIINSQILVVTLEYLGDIRVG
jgi:hypothetical protein